jgi:hypothetical protein
VSEHSRRHRVADSPRDIIDKLASIRLYLGDVDAEGLANRLRSDPVERRLERNCVPFAAWATVCALLRPDQFLGDLGGARDPASSVGERHHASIRKVAARGRGIGRKIEPEPEYSRPVVGKGQRDGDPHTVRRLPARASVLLCRLRNVTAKCR